MFARGRRESVCEVLLRRWARGGREGEVWARCEREVGGDAGVG